MRRQRNKSQKGSAILEFALSWTVLVALVAGVYQFGYTFYIYNQLMTSVADAAELGSKMDYDTGSPGAYTTALTNMVLYGDTTAGAKPIVAGLSASNVDVNVTILNSVPQDLTITIKGLTVDAVFTSFTFNGKPRATTIYMGHVVCSGAGC
jgi:Flp pilus assembly protein TadG